ncbi:hypothetical protein L249_8831, partial [Ophiocordyceps polyrhachis-furcata BCC 54312]
QNSSSLVTYTEGGRHYTKSSATAMMHEELDCSPISAWWLCLVVFNRTGLHLGYTTSSLAMASPKRPSTKESEGCIVSDQ